MLSITYVFLRVFSSKFSFVKLISTEFPWSSRVPLLENLSNDDGDGNENVVSI